MPLLSPLRKYKRKAKELSIGARIRLKWLRDCRQLPLTTDHFELYKIIHRHYFQKMGKFPNLIQCRDYNDKIQWLKLFDQDIKIIRCSDKILVRDYVKERVGGQCLVRLFRTADRFFDIDFDSLPESFVVKANNDSGTVILVQNKESLDRKSAAVRIDKALKRIFGWENGEWAYSYVRPRVLVEEFIGLANNTPPPDYKFHCVDGKVKWLQYISDRSNDKKEEIADNQGNIQPIIFDWRFQRGNGFVKPSNWEKMVEIAERLAAGFKYVRVDLYNVAGHIYVGEMTFFPAEGCYKEDGQRLLGRYLDFDRSTVKPLVSLRT